MLNKTTMNQIIKRMAKKQNTKKKLNAGQLRESVRIFLDVLIEMSNDGLEANSLRYAIDETVRKKK